MAAHSEEILSKMLDRLRHRGPDDRGEEKFSLPGGQTLYLGHQRLSIIDLSPLGHQPMANDDRSVWISTNSEIFNFKEIRNTLASKYEFRSQSDTEVLLKAYEEWGVDCLERLRGMFAFAIWDSRQNHLFLARDRLGIKPLYYYFDNRLFLFASETRALTASGLVDPDLNPSGIYQYLSFGNFQSPETIYSGIKELKPAHFLLLRPDDPNPSPKRYWSPIRPDLIDASGLPLTGRVFSCLEESIRYRMVSDAPLGAFLSGGIDSSAVVGLMHNSPGIRTKTLSVVFREKEYDESEYSDWVSSAFQTDHTALMLEEKDLLEALPAAITAMDQPTVDGINTFIISRCARGLGLKVALSGLGGDELFGGYDSFKLAPRLARLDCLLKLFPKTARSLGGRLFETLLPRSDQNTKLSHLVRGRISGEHVFFLLRSLFCDDQIRGLIVDESIMREETRKNLLSTKALLEPVLSRGIRDQVSYLEMTHYMANTLLRDTDVMSMANSLEIRVPLIDHRLVELMFSIPENEKFSRESPKSLLVNSLNRKLPDKMVSRKKMGFTLPFESWLRNHLKNEVESVLMTPSPFLEGLISESGVREIWKDFLARRVSWSRPWALYVLKQWVAMNLGR